MNYRPPALCLVLTVLLLAASGANAAPFSFTTGAPDSRIALASRPSSGGGEEIETGDVFVLATTTAITSATLARKSRRPREPRAAVVGVMTSSRLLTGSLRVV